MDHQANRPPLRELTILSVGLAAAAVAWGIGVRLSWRFIEGHDRFDLALYSGCGLAAVLFFAVLLTGRSWAKRRLISAKTQIRIEMAAVTLLAVAAVCLSVALAADYRSRTTGEEVLSMLLAVGYTVVTTTVCFALAARRVWKKGEPIAGIKLLGPIVLSCTSLALLFLAFWCVVLPAIFLRIVSIYGGQPIVEGFLAAIIASLHIGGVFFVWSFWRKEDAPSPLR